MVSGLDPDSPYVTQRPGQRYFFYKVEGERQERRTEAVALADIDERLSCARFRDPDWLATNRPDFHPQLAKAIQSYAAAVPQETIVMPQKGSKLSQGELDFEDPLDRIAKQAKSEAGR